MLYNSVTTFIEKLKLVTSQVISGPEYIFLGTRYWLKFAS